jgi:hypothetical protein
LRSARKDKGIIMDKSKKYAEGGVATENASVNTNMSSGNVENSRSEGLAKAIADKRAFEEKLKKMREMAPKEATVYKKAGGSVKKAKPKCMARGGGCEVRGKTKGRFV